MIGLLIAVICGILYRCGGTDQWNWCAVNQKLWRKFIGIFLALIFCWKNPWALLCCVTYWIPDLFPYGEKSWLNIFGEELKFGINGFVFGLALSPVVGISGVLQAFIALMCFMAIRVLDEKGIVKNPWVEFLRGFTGTITLAGAI